ncbi:MAG: alpha-glucan family phosphorylase, partial [Oligoflexales bacterium]|nr:alpha-glucan family phosphorylase [Oligoflexales bacterium]
MSSKKSSERKSHIAYFSMEIGFKSQIPTYSGGLGVLAGDTLKSAADLELPVVGVSLVYHKGYFKQKIDKAGRQIEEPVKWNPDKEFTKVNKTVTVEINGKKVNVSAYRYDLVGVTGHVVPLFFLDTNLKSNSKEHRELCDYLYGGDVNYRLSQEIVLGMGGIALLEELGYKAEPKDGTNGVTTYHMNEGHASLLTMGLLKVRLGRKTLSHATSDDFSWVKERCVFTTHTPVPAGHDVFSQDLAEELLSPDTVSALKKAKVLHKTGLNMTVLALTFSRHVNGVAKRHGEVSREMFPKYKITAITNGIHAASWVSKPFAALFDRELPAWRENNFKFRDMLDVPLDRIDKAHAESKKILLSEVRARTGAKFDPNVFTIGFARRAATYKRADLLLHDVKRLIKIADRFGGIQIIYSGKAHPKDMGGKELIEKVVKGSKHLAGSKIKLTYLEDYNMELGRLITTGVDLWLNNPIKPLEASGTSGMKAALNGVPNFSTLDGWWVEGHIENATGWEIMDPWDGMKNKTGKDDRKAAANSLYEKLEKIILPLYYKNYNEYLKIMRQSIALNGSYFNTHRMV